MRQVDGLELDEGHLKYAEEIVGWIDERGYLSAPLPKISEECGHDEANLFEALRTIQSLEPTGVGARDLRECLLLQLDAKGLKNGLAWKLVSSHLDELGEGRLSGLQKILGASSQELEMAKSQVSELEPNPGRPFGGELNPAITVDASVFVNGKGDWEISLKDDYIPRLGINRYYKEMMKQSSGIDKKETQDYLKEKYQSALWLMRGIEQRKRTLRKVLEVIVEVQTGFLEQGPAAFKPLALKDVAEVCGVHESTVSRVTTNKYLQTPRGVFELKYFFSGGLKSSSGEDESAMAIKEKLKELLAEEKPQAPLSDQALADKLQETGTRIARRTVAKYREELKVLPAHRRKQRKE